MSSEMPQAHSMHLIERQPYTSLGLFLFLLGCAHMVSISATQTLLAGLIIYVFYRIYRRDYDIAVLPHVIAFALLFVLASLSAFLGVNPQRSMGKVFGWWIYLFFAAMFLLSYYQVRVLPHLTLFVTLGADAAAGLGVYQYFIGGLERANGFFTHALTYANQAKKSYPSQVQGYYLAGFAYSETKQWSRAYQEFETCDRVLPGNPQMTFLKGYTQEQQGKREPAAQNYISYLKKINYQPNQYSKYAYARLQKWGYAR